MVNVRTVKNALKLNENVMQNYFSICIYSSAATLKVAKWYISKNFHSSKLLIWKEYIIYIKLALNGERQGIRVAILEIINS